MSEILVRMKVDVWKGTAPEISWVQVTRITRHSVCYEVIRARKDGKGGDVTIEKEERLFSRLRLERVESAARGRTTPGAAVIYWVQDDREPIQGGYCWQMALFNCLEQINADFRAAAVRINELEDQLTELLKECGGTPHQSPAATASTPLSVGSADISPRRGESSPQGEAVARSEEE